jgi:putative ABC transport system substrate-binding protein
MKRRDFIAAIGGASVAWPLLARAQQPVPTIGVLSSADLPDWATKGIRSGLDDAGYAEGRNLNVLYRSAKGQFDQLPALAADLVHSQVSAILATGSPVPARVAKAATTTIPIVFAYGGDPISDGLVASFNRPGGNVTGATFIGTALTAKRMELLKEIAPGITDVAILVNPKGTLAVSQTNDAKAAAETLRLSLHVINVSSESEIDDAFVAMKQSKVGAFLVSTDPFFGFLGRDRLIGLAARYGIPAIYNARAEAGSDGLVSYGANLTDTWRQAGVYIGRILKGEKPSELPVVQPAKFELVINLKTAKALGLTVKPSLLGLADEVIE